ncbi:uncharacterized protein LOC114526156 isoform X2 [Dendronephthya gigantea]|nr:uncharacterized protein LOC114526156 isoform X2 [Dendronephthya gigantea]
MQEDTGQSESHVVKGPPLKRSTSGFNIFTSKLLSSDECKKIESKSEKMTFVATKWQSLSDSERSVWKNEAKNIKRVVPSLLTLEEKKKQIAKSKKNLIKELTYLESLGCESAVLMHDSGTGTVNQYGSAKGAQFLLQDNAVALKFMNFFDTTNRGPNYTNKDVRDLFNKKYSEACGKPGSRVPYLKKGFTVTGLPNGIEFRKPNNYGEEKVKAIMNAQEGIVFQLEPEPSITHSDPAVTEEIDPQQAELQHILCKVVDQEKALQVVTDQICIEESDMEVTDLALTDMEYNLLTTNYRNCFTEDALTALAANYKSFSNHKGYILPVYTDTEDAYWLFYFPDKMSDLLNQHSQQQIWGYWLNATEDKLTFKLIMSKNKVSIDTLNIITKENNSSSFLFLQKTLLLKTKTTVNLPEPFHDQIYAILNEYGFI